MEVFDVSNLQLWKFFNFTIELNKMLSWKTDPSWENWYRDYRREADRLRSNLDFVSAAKVYYQAAVAARHAGLHTQVGDCFFAACWSDPDPERSFLYFQLGSDYLQHHFPSDSIQWKYVQEMAKLFDSSGTLGLNSLPEMQSKSLK